MSDNEPRGFNDLPGAPDESPTRTDVKPLFSRPGSAPEVTAAAETTASVAAHSGTTPGIGASLTMSSRWRWAVAGLVTVLVVGLLGVAFHLGQPGSGTPSTVARYAPSDTAYLIELRQDLPGDQHNLLAQFMSHFPGFADQAAFDSKLDETVNELVERLSEGGPKHFDYDHHFKPWFGGQVGIFSSNLNPSPGTPPSMTVVLTVKAGQRAVLEEWLNPERNDGWTQSTYEGSTIWTGQFLVSNERLNLTWSDEALVVSARIEDLQAALDARADRAPGLADDQYFLQQLAPLHADRLGTFYFDGRALAQQMRDQADALGMPGTNEAMYDALATRVLGEIRAEGDHMAVTTRTERPANSNLPPLPGNRATNLAELAPSDALVYAEVRDVGQMIGFYVEQSLLPLASGEAPFDLSNLQQMLGVPPQDFFDFIVDASLSVSGAPDALQFGLVATVDDETIATSRVNKLVSLLRAMMLFGGGVTIDDEQHGAATLTVITLSGGRDGSPETSLALSITGGRLLIGTHDFVIGVLDRTRDQSLAARPEYQAALAAGGASNAGVVFVDLAAALSAYEAMVPADERADYDLNKKPFLAPLSHLAMISTTDSGQQINHVFLYVK